MREEGRMRQGHGEQGSAPQHKVMPQPSGYSRYDQERFKGKEGIKTFK